MTITDCCRALENGRCTSRELTRQFLARIEEKNQTPVSYTHLDVYKRQVKTWMPTSLRRRICFRR